MRNILIIGAGRSATSLIKYLLDKSEKEDLFITIGDLSIESAQKFSNGHPNAKGIKLDVFDAPQRSQAIKSSDLVISMLPARFHIEVAKDCILYKKHLVTASYVSDEMQALDEDAKANGLVFMNEIGVDPGIDHMSAMQVIDRIRDAGGIILGFESFTGGLLLQKVITIFGIINLHGIQETLFLQDKEGQLNLSKRGELNIFHITDFSEEQNFWMLKDMDVLKHWPIGIH